MPRLIHPLAGMIALLMLTTFWTSTLIAELFLTQAAVVAVKTTIPWGFLILVPALITTSASGFILSGGQASGLIGAKKKRMPFIAMNGLLILVPAGLFMAAKARAGQFDTPFHIALAIDLVASPTNIFLLFLSMRDGFRLTRWRRRNFLRPARKAKTTVEARRELTAQTVAITLKRPPGFRFTAGQAVYVDLPGLKAKDGKGRIRAFSIASPPGEENLVIATRRSESEFKRNLGALTVGSSVTIEGPYGDLVLHDDARPVILIAGGIGITPFRSMILDSSARMTGRDLLLIYSSGDRAGAAFLDELQELADGGHCRLVVTTTAEAVETVEHGHVTLEMIKRHVPDIASPTFYIAGPPAMVDEMTAILAGAGVKTDNIRAEEFAGY